MKLPAWLTQFGLVGERKALALLCLAAYATLFALMGLIAMSQIPEWTACFFAMAACYGVGFFAVAAGWFWGRWFAVGLGYSGLTMAIMAIVATRDLSVAMLVFGAMHGLMAICLLGEKMQAVYEARTDWRQRWKLDDQGVARVRASVTRAASSLPSLILWVLAPREGAEVALLALAGIGLFGLLRGRAWGVLVLGASGFAAIAGAAASAISGHTEPLAFGDGAGVIPSGWLAAAAGVALLAATAPFARGIAHKLLRPART
jgi:hypothetical protein